MNIFQPYGISKKEFNKIKNLILCNKMDEIPADYKLWSESIKRDYLPAEFNKSYAYDVKGNAHKYLGYTLKMSEDLEELNNNNNNINNNNNNINNNNNDNNNINNKNKSKNKKNKNKKNKKNRNNKRKKKKKNIIGEKERPKLIKLFQVCSFRSSIIPAYTTLDAAVIASLFKQPGDTDKRKHIAKYKRFFLARFSN